MTLRSSREVVVVVSFVFWFLGSVPSFPLYCRMLSRVFTGIVLAVGSMPSFLRFP